MELLILVLGHKHQMCIDGHYFAMINLEQKTTGYYFARLFEPWKNDSAPEKNISSSMIISAREWQGIIIKMMTGRSSASYIFVNFVLNSEHGLGLVLHMIKPDSRTEASQDS